jgi:hypothetical protein
MASDDDAATITAEGSLVFAFISNSDNPELLCCCFRWNRTRQEAKPRNITMMVAQMIIATTMFALTRSLSP